MALSKPAPPPTLHAAAEERRSPRASRSADQPASQFASLSACQPAGRSADDADDDEEPGAAVFAERERAGANPTL